MIERINSNLNPQQVINKIREVFDNFPAAYEKQVTYRARILDDKNRFTNEVADAFEIKELPTMTVAFVQGVVGKIFFLAQMLFKSSNFMPSFIVDDLMATTEVLDDLLLREQNRNFLRVGENFVEIITRDDAKFLYLEGRIKKFVLFEPTDAELDELKNFYEPNYKDVLIFNR